MRIQLIPSGWGSGGGVLTGFKSQLYFTEGSTDLPGKAIGPTMGPIASTGGGGGGRGPYQNL